MTHLSRALTSLRSRNFRLYWFGQMISLMGTRIQGIGQVWLVLALTFWALARRKPRLFRA